MKFVNLFKSALMVMVAMMVAVACTEPVIPDVPNDPNNPENPNNPEDPNNPEGDKVLYLELESDNVMNFPVEGGRGILEWSILEKEADNTRNEPVEPQTATEQEWIKIHPTQRKTFDVEPNEGDERVGKITITYGEQSIDVTINQAGVAQEPKPDNCFTIAVQEVHASTAITQVTPADDEMYYVMFLEEVSYLQNGGFTTSAKLWEDDYTAFEGGAINSNMNLKEYMVKSTIACQGIMRVQWNSVRPGVNSVLYVYGIKFAEDGASYEPVTEISWVTIKPDYAPLQDVAFDLDVKVSGADVVLGIKPEGWNGHYLVKIVDANDDLYVGEGVAFDDEYMKTISDEWIASFSANLSGGHPIENILEQVCYKGEVALEQQLSAYTLYSALVYPVAEYDGFMQVVAKPSYINFSTEEVGKSDMDINIEVSNCYVRVTDLKITPSNPEESWILMITPTAYLPAGYTDQVLLDYALGEFSYYTYAFKGEITTHLNTLYPNTEYIVVAFGYSGGVVTTDVCSKVFKTQPEGKCELEITDVIVGGPFRPSDLYNYDPETFKYYTKPYYYDSSQFIVTIEVKTSVPTKDIFSYFVSKADYDWLGYEDTFFDLLIDTCDPLAITEGFWDYGAYYATAAAFDYKGNVTPMWMSNLYDWTMDDFRPIEEFIEKWESQSQVMVMGVKADGAIVPMNKLR